MNVDLPPALARFDPRIASWFQSRFEEPTAIQQMAWPHIRDGDHVLLTAPTGSGKTLTAFLWAVNQLVTGEWPPGQMSVLYVSPLKALNNDIQTNLREPLSELRQMYTQNRLDFPDISVLTRSGDTPQNERQRMVRRPPEILITTPESLNLILSSSRARHMLSTVRTVILDEIHAVLQSKRGTHLITAVDRVTRMAGEVQRIALSATVKPLEVVGRFVAGYRRVGDGYEPRRIVTLEAPSSKRFSFLVDFAGTGAAPDSPTAAAVSETVWPALTDQLHTIINRNKSTLIFVTTRRHAEKITGLLNGESGQPIAYAHHGSLSAEIRKFVETSLKAGRLKAIVATNSLELGIDIGDLDEVVMIKAPMNVSSALQRLGRAGHRVSAVSRGVLFPLFGRDAIDSAVVARAALDQDIEPSRPISTPLDVLAQQIISMCAVEKWNLDELYSEIRCSWPFNALERKTFDLVVQMLAGRYAQTRIRELKPRVLIDAIGNTIRTREGVLPVLYRSGGTIPDRGYYGLRHAGHGARIGELDEEFVWERRVGDTFYLGSQLWTVVGISDRDVEVVPGAPGAQVIPFWKAEARGRGTHFAELTLEFLEDCEIAMASDGLDEMLMERRELSESARHLIKATLTGQRQATGTPLPHRHHIVVERCLAAAGDRRRPRESGTEGEPADEQEIIIHCPWGLGVTQPLAMTLEALRELEDGSAMEVFADDNCLALRLGPDVSPAGIIGPAVCRSLLRPGRIEELLRSKLEHSGLFGALFRENAGRALLLPRGGFDRRMPLWLNRLKSRKLLDTVEMFDDFPMVLETWRTCLQDQFDLDSLRRLLGEIASGAVRVSLCETSSPSLFASEMVWRQTDHHMYRDDSRPGGRGSALGEDLLSQAAQNAALRPDIPRSLSDELERRLQRCETGYAPTSGDDLVDWVRERLAIPEREAAVLHEASVRDVDSPDLRPEDRPLVLRPAPDVLCWIVRPDTEPLLVATDQLPVMKTLVEFSAGDTRRVTPDQWWLPGTELTGPGFNEAVQRLASGVDPPDPTSVLSQWLRFYGPRPVDFPARVLGMDAARGERLIDELAEDGVLVVGSFCTDSDQPELCDRENLEHLLALLRRSHRRVFEPVSADRLVTLWSRLTGLRPPAPEGDPAGDPEDLVSVLDGLFGYPAPVALWESDILPSRLPGYFPLWMDGLFKDSDLVWYGCGRERVSFLLAEDLSLLEPSEEPRTENVTARVVEALRESGPCDLPGLRSSVDLSSEEVTRGLWSAAWAGEVSNDSFDTLRKGAVSGFSPVSVAAAGQSRWPGRRGRSASRAGWAMNRPLSGKWFAVELREPDDPISRLEADKECARILLARYGLVFRELLQRELPRMRWSTMFRALRMMELSGEVVAGAFVADVHSLQFATPQALSLLAKESGDVIWMNAMDPASPCGLEAGKLFGDLPPRVAGNHLVFRGTELVLVSRRNGSELSIAVGPDDPDLPAMLAPLRNMVSRRWNPRPRVSVESINGLPALESPFASRLEGCGFRRDYRRLILSAGYR